MDFSRIDMTTAFIDIPEDSEAIEQLQLAYRLGDIDRREYMTRTSIEKELESLTRELLRDGFDGAEFYRQFCSGLQSFIEEGTRRACGVCLCKAPARLAAFRDCGHVCCLACAQELQLKAGFSARALAHRRCACPFCRYESAVIPLMELQTEDETSAHRKCAMLEEEEDEEDADKAYWIRAYLNRKIKQKDYIYNYMDCLQNADKAHRSKNGGAKGQIHAAECKRLEAELGRANVCEDLAMSAAEAAWKKEKKESIERLRAENGESDHTHHRKCVSCSSRSPRINCAFTACGHVVCGPCALHSVHVAEAKAAEREISHAGRTKIRADCPLCEKNSAIVRMFEQVSTVEKEE